MADLTKVLGVMMAARMAGRSSKLGAVAAATPVLFGKGTPGGGWSFSQKAGLAALGYLAYRAYSDSQTAAPPQPAKSGGLFGSVLGSLGMGGRSAADSGFGDRLASGLRGPATPPQIESGKAHLLIRAMVAAAAADGEISAEERRSIMSRLDQAGAGPEERRIVEGELNNPPGVEAIVREVRDPDTAAEVYLASNLAVVVDTPAERAYLDYLATRLKITPDQKQELDRLL
jgi:uncharacterized membrane protein YebE (DUF533 family)